MSASKEMKAASAREVRERFTLRGIAYKLSGSMGGNQGGDIPQRLVRSIGWYRAEAHAQNSMSNVEREMGHGGWLVQKGNEGRQKSNATS